MATHSSILAWEIPWTESGGLGQRREARRASSELSCRHLRIAIGFGRSALCDLSARHGGGLLVTDGNLDNPDILLALGDLNLFKKVHTLRLPAPPSRIPGSPQVMICILDGGGHGLSAHSPYLSGAPAR